MNNKYHLHVYKLSNVTTESPTGFSASVRMKEIWDAPFKDEESLIKSILDYTGRGFYCQVVKN
jgi:hypothetical protein